MKKVIFILCFFLLCGCALELDEEVFEPIRRNAWEDGVFWGYKAAKDGATETNYLLKAYEKKAKAGEDVKAENERLSKYRYPKKER